MLQRIIQCFLLMVDSQLRTVCVMIFCGYVETYLSSYSHIIPAVLNSLWRPEGWRKNSKDWGVTFGRLRPRSLMSSGIVASVVKSQILMTSVVIFHYIYISLYIHDVPIKEAFFLVKSPLFITMSSLSSPFPSADRLTFSPFPGRCLF